MVSNPDLSTDRKRGWKKAVGDRARKILNDSELNDPIISDDDLFLRELIKLHPEADNKIGPGVMYFEVRENSWGGRNFWLIRTDLSETDFSFLKAISPPSDMYNFASACRRAVASDVVAAKSIIFHHPGGVFCPITGDKLTWDTCHIDHAPPMTFDVISREFAATRLDIKSDVEPSHDGDLITYFKYPEVAELFREFHKEMAHLRAVSKTANLSILKKQYVKGQ